MISAFDLAEHQQTLKYWINRFDLASYAVNLLLPAFDCDCILAEDQRVSSEN